MLLEVDENFIVMEICIDRQTERQTDKSDRQTEILLENEDTADGLFSACSAFAKGILPDVAATLFLLQD